MIREKKIVAGGLEIIKELRDWISNLACKANCQKKIIDDIAIAVSEAVANIVKHGYMGSSKAHINVSVEFNDKIGDITIYFRDYGRKFNLKNYIPPDLDTPSEGGYGIFLMQSVMDEVSFEFDHDQGTGLKMVKKTVFHY